MQHTKKISSALSVAATVLLEACSSSGSDGSTGPTPVANTTAPELLGTWETPSCVTTQNSGSTNTNTSASGGSGGGSISGGEGYLARAEFTQDGRVEFSTEYYANAECNANTLFAVSDYNAVYIVGGAAVEINGSSPVTAIDISDASSTTYSIFQVVNNDQLRLGDASASTPGNDGRNDASRLDAFGPRMLKQ